jgi:regulator of protease activity HflC (stomatin/prohibitin superfamily)
MKSFSAKGSYSSESGWGNSAGKIGAGLGAYLPTGLSFLVLLGLVLLVIFYNTCTQYIKPDELAIKQVDMPIPFLTGAKGIHTNVYGTGIHWLVRGCEKFIVFPKSLRVVTLHSSTRNEGAREKYVRFEDAAHIQTSDGFFINLDVSILYRVVDPAKVVKEFGAGNLYEQNGIIFQAEPTLKATMGTLHPEDFFNSVKRVAKQDETRDKFNEFLNPRGLRVEHVLIRYPQYHEAVQARIEARNIQEQTKQKNVEEAKLALAQADLQEVEKQGEAAFSIKLMEGSNFVTRLTAQMEAYQRKRRSEGNKVIALAEAEKQRMINQAYQGAGSDRLVGLEWARVLAGLDTIILQSGGDNGFNPFDLDKLMKQLKIQSGEGR